VNEKGTYLLVDITIPGNPTAGLHPITIHTRHGDASAPFEILGAARSADAGRKGFDPTDVIYLVMTDRFSNGDSSNDDPQASRGLFDPSNPRYYHGGDFKGIRDRLPYLKQLGITALWLTPWYDNVNHLNEREMPEGKPITDYHGYGAIDFYGVEEHFGELQTLKGLIDEAHRQGIKVIQDEVVNHTGPYHPWVQDPPTPSWFHGTATNHLNETWQLWPLIDPYATEALKRQTLDGWFVNILPDLNQDDPDVAQYLIQNTLWWIGVTGIDGIRMDTVPYVPRSFWTRWTTAISKEFPKVNTVGEVFDGDPAIGSSYQRGALTVFDFPSYFKVRDVIANARGSARELATVLAHDGLYPHPESLVTFIGNHDVTRFMSEPGATADRLKLAFTWLLTARGTPMIYYGDEIGMLGGNDPDNRRDFPKEFTPGQQAMHDYVAELLKLRASIPALRSGRTVTLCATENDWTYARVLPGQVAIVQIGKPESAGRVACDLSPLHLKGEPHVVAPHVWVYP